MAVKTKRRLLSERSALSIVVPIATFAPEALEVVAPVPVVIQASQDGYLASFFDANLNAFGETQQQAYANLKDIIVAVFGRLGEEPKTKLGKEPLRQLKVLQRFIRRM